MPLTDIMMHLLEAPDTPREQNIHRENPIPLLDNLAKRLQAAKIDRSLLSFLDPEVLRNEKFLGALRQRSRWPGLHLGSLLDFRDPQPEALVDRAADAGLKAIKFHPYLQRIEPGDYSKIERAARQAESRGLILTICTAHGTRVLYRHCGVELAAHLAGVVRCPILMAHGGGALVLDAMLAAQDAPNLFLDTSYSLPFWQGSSVEQDFAFAMKKLGTDRWVFGSDGPYMDPVGSRETVAAFLERNGFSDRDREKIFHETASRLLGG